MPWLDGIPGALAVIGAAIVIAVGAILLAKTLRLDRLRFRLGSRARMIAEIGSGCARRGPSADQQSNMLAIGPTLSRFGPAHGNHQSTCPDGYLALLWKF